MTGRIAWQKSGLKQPKFKPEPTYRTYWVDIDGTRTLVSDREVKGGERQMPPASWVGVLRSNCSFVTAAFVLLKMGGGGGGKGGG